MFVAATNQLSLKSFDDCCYARKGLEMWRRGASLTVSWAGQPDFTYPPLQFWIVGRSFAILGASDFAARFPSILMALGILFMTYRIGKLTVGRGAALAGVAVLMLTPLFVTNARRCMTEIPLCFWTTLALLLFLLGLKRPRLHALFAVPLGAAILTKSVLGLIPLIVVPAAVASPHLRRSLRNSWLWLGIVGGLAIGASWTIHQTIHFGDAFLSTHYGTMVTSRVFSGSGGPVASSSYPDYLTILIEHYQPIVLLAAAGLVLFIVRRLRARGDRSDLLLAWALLPIVLYSFSQLRHYRYLFPLLPAFALFSGYVIYEKARPLARWLVACVVPTLCVIGALLYWFAPGTLVRCNNMAYKEHAGLARSALPAGSALPYLSEAGDDYWREENPLMWYWDVGLERSSSTANEAVAKALATEHRSMICVRSRIDDIDALGIKYEIPVGGKHWVWVRFAEETRARGAPDAPPE